MFQSGDAVGEYILEEKLGEGAYGVVFRARNAVSEKCFALKIVPLAGRAGKRELHALKRYREFDHKNLLKIHHAGISGDYLYYTMDLADGKLADAHFNAAQLREAAEKISDALALLHRNKLLHRDIKPDNLFLRDGNALLGDIGLITSGSEATFSGTPGFLSPRIWKEALPPDEKNDLYALAKTFYCLLSGNAPREYPRYQGEMNEDASILLDAIFSVCDDDGTISGAAGFRDRIRTQNPPPMGRKFRIFRRELFSTREKFFRFVKRSALAFAVIVALAVAVFFVRYQFKVAAARKLLQEKIEAQRRAELREKLRRERDDKAWAYAYEKVPKQQIESIDNFIKRDVFVREYRKRHPLPDEK